MMLDEGRLDHDVTEIFLDAIVASQHPFDDRLIMHHAARHEFGQIAVAAAYQMAFEDFIEFANAYFNREKSPERCSASVTSVTTVRYSPSLCRLIAG